MIMESPTSDAQLQAPSAKTNIAQNHAGRCWAAGGLVGGSFVSFLLCASRLGEIIVGEIFDPAPASTAKKWNFELGTQ